MQELQIANNRVFSHIIDQDEIYAYELRTEGYKEFKRLYEISSDEHNAFKTPVNFSSPSGGPGYQYNATCGNEFKEYVTRLINEQFNSELEIKESWYLHQTDDEWIDNPVHMHMTASWIAVVYLDIKEGDAIQFYDAAGNMESYEPQFGEILFFPGSASHKPAPNVSSKRLTFNIEFGRREYTQEEMDTIKNRYVICKSCDKYNAETEICSVCSCFVPMKIQMLDMDCPINKW
jgi:hypothetical protein